MPIHHQTISTAIDIARDAMPFMLWNTFLALVPLVLATALFSSDRRKLIITTVLALALAIPRGPAIANGLLHLMQFLSPLSLVIIASLVLVALWLCLASAYRQRARVVIGGIAFVLFLPNAPYVLTDVIHMIETIRVYPSEFVLTIVVIPLYALFMLIGFGAYVLAVMEFAAYARRFTSARTVVGLELMLHALSAVGVFMGRFLRFNSWDIATAPDSVITQSMNSLMSRNVLIVLFVSFVIITILYTLGKTIVSALRLHRSHKRSGTPQAIVFSAPSDRSAVA